MTYGFQLHLYVYGKRGVALQDRQETLFYRDRPDDLMRYVKAKMYDPAYAEYIPG